MTYLLKTPHTAEDCLKALDEQLAKGSDVLDKFYYGCETGDHTGYAIVDADSESDAFSLVPTFLRDNSSVIKLGKFTPEMIRSFHAKAA